MTGFLRLFAEFRDLEARNAFLEAKNDQLVDQCSSLFDQLAQAQHRIDTAHRSEIDATRKMTDFIAVDRFSRPIFKLASPIPAPPDLSAIPTGKPQARDLAAQMEREFFKTYAKAPEPTQ